MVSSRLDAGNNELMWFDAGNGNKIADILITECDDGSYCYGDNNRECCRQGQGVFVLNGEQVSFNPTSTSISSASTPPVSTSGTSPGQTSSASHTQEAANSPTDTGNPAQEHSSGLSTGAKAGLGVGIAVGAILVLVFCFWFFRRKRRSRAIPELENKEKTDYQSQPNLLSKSNDPAPGAPLQQNISELDAHSRLEPYRDTQRYELGSH